MAKLLQIGMSTASELGMRFGHIACTLGGVNYESRGSRGCVKGKKARGAADGLFRHRFHLVLSDEQAVTAKAYADSCVGQPYKLGLVPSATSGGDCSGFMSGIIWAAKGKPPPHKRLFATATWQSRFDDPDLDFKTSLGRRVPRDEEDDMQLTDKFEMRRPDGEIVTVTVQDALGAAAWLFHFVNSGRLQAAVVSAEYNARGHTVGQALETSKDGVEKLLRPND